MFACERASMEYNAGCRTTGPLAHPIVSATLSMLGAATVSRTFTEQELAEFLFDRLIVQGPSCPDTSWLRPACEQVAEELLSQAEVLHRTEPVSDGGA
jgi:hypothetical protein